MFNGDIKRRALEKLKTANDKYQEEAESAKSKALQLYQLRVKVGVETISMAENYINILANSPKKFDKSVKKLRISYEKFDKTIEEVEASDVAALVGGGTAAAGMAAGAGVVTLAPAAAMAIATTFGTASTGTAIATLSGAAATNAALAWLGGGALVAGGGGMAAGETLLALSGPIGWGIGGAILAGSALWARKKNKEVAEDATCKAIEIEKNLAKMKAISSEVQRIVDLTQVDIAGVSHLIKKLKNESPNDYLKFTVNQKRELGSLVNSIESLSKLLNLKIGAD